MPDGVDNAAQGKGWILPRSHRQANKERKELFFFALFVCFVIKFR